MKGIELVATARPNFMKIAPLWHALAKEPWAIVYIMRRITFLNQDTA